MHFPPFFLTCVHTRDLTRRSNRFQRYNTPLHSNPKVAPGSLTVYNFTEAFAPQFLRCGLHPELRAAQAKAVQTLVDVDGCKVVNVTHDDLPEISEAFAICT